MLSVRPPQVPQWNSRWSQIARASEIEPGEKLLVALSGGADSVLLLHLLAAAEPRPEVRAVHVHHGLRGDEADGDARFCANLCRALGVPFEERSVELERRGPSLEARARDARYRALAEEAERTGHTTILTGHHTDDALETLIMRWVRGTSIAGLPGPRRQRRLARDLRVVRPLLTLRREEVRRLLSDRGLRWREDSSNEDPSHTRNRVRNAFLPQLERLCGSTGVENLRAFGRAVEALEDRLAAATAHLSWSRPPYVLVSRGPNDAELGGVLRRAELMRVAAPLRRRALWRLLTEGIGRSPGRSLIEHIEVDLGLGRCTRHALPGGWTLLLRADELHLLPPASLRRATLAAPSEPKGREQGLLPFPPTNGRPELAEPFAPAGGYELSVPGIVSLPDGRRLSAELVEGTPDFQGPKAGKGLGNTELVAELDAEGLPELLSIRWPLRGDRFHGLGAPGSKQLSRYLADRGIPREERATVPVVLAAGEIVWVAGIGPAHARRLRPSTGARVRLELHPGGSASR